MHKCQLLFVSVLSCQSTLAFAPNFRRAQKSRNFGETTTLHVVPDTDSSETPKKPLTSQDIIARARKNIGVPDDEPDSPPRLFDESLYNDMRACLDTLEKRATGGTLSVEEVVGLETKTQRISKEMKDHAAEGGPTPPDSKRPVLGNPSSLPDTASAGSGGITVPAAPVQEQVVKSATQGASNRVTDTSNDEGPAYTGEGGMGMAKGTRNTYVIPGMDEMSPEEYRDALQKSVIARQGRRKEGRGGLVGNRAAHDYLNQLGWGGASKSLSKGKNVEENTEEKED